MAGLTRDVHGLTRTRLLDLVPGRSGEAYRSWLHGRGPALRDRVEIATLDPFHRYKNAIDDQLEDARAVLDAFHVVKLATNVVDDVRRRVQQQIQGHQLLESFTSCPIPEVARLAGPCGVAPSRPPLRLPQRLRARLTVG